MDEKTKRFYRKSMNGGVHLVLGDASSKQDDLLRVLVEDAILSGSSLLVFDTLGYLTSFVLPFLPGDHLKKIRNLNKKVSESLLEKLNPMTWIFNSRIDAGRDDVIKYTFPITRIFMDLVNANDAVLRQACGCTKDGLMKDVILNLVIMAFGKDYKKYIREADEFVEILTRMLYIVAEKQLKFQDWTELKQILLHSLDFNQCRPDDLNKNDFEAFLFTLDYFLSNSLLFKKGTENLTEAGFERAIKANFNLFYMQDMNKDEISLVFDLIFVECLLNYINVPGRDHHPFKPIMDNPDQDLVFDQISTIFEQEGPYKDFDPARRFFFKGILGTGRDLLVACKDPGALDYASFHETILQSSNETNIFIGKVKKRKDIESLSDSMRDKGVNLDINGILGLTPGNFLHYPGGFDKSPASITAGEPSVVSFQMKPQLFKRMLSTAVFAPLLSKPSPSVEETQKQELPVIKPVPEPIQTRVPEPEPMPAPEPIPEPEPEPMPAPEPIPEPEPEPMPAPEHFPEPIPTRVPEPEPMPAPEPIPEPEPEPMPAPEPIPEPEPEPMPAPEAFPEPAIEPEGKEPGLTTLLDEIETADTLIEGNEEEITDLLDEIETGDELDEKSFLSELLSPEVETIAGTLQDKEIVSKLNFDLILNTLLFKLGDIVKTPYGLEFFKNIMQVGEMNYEQAMVTYYEETRKMLKTGFAIHEGNFIKYKGLDKAIEALIKDLGVEVSMPDQEKIKMLEENLLKALELPKNELLDKIKNGSYYF
ncbi:MAG: hypothetical protein ACFFCS_00735 [Candidatus Hodarchaeota archaeon]